MHFTNPIFLWALSGLAIPLGIHLLSKKEGKVIRIGSLRHLQETSTQQFRGIRLNEILLLMLRCLLIILFVFILSGLQLNSLKKTKWVVVENGLPGTSSVIIDSLKFEGYELHWLTEGFPAVNPGDTTSDSPEINYRKAIDQLTKLQISDVIIFAKNKPDKFKGMRTSLPSTFRWISQSAPPLNYILAAIKINSDSVLIRKGLTNESETVFENEKISGSISIDAKTRETISVLLVGDENHSFDKKIMDAVLAAIDRSFPIELVVTSATPSTISNSNQNDWIIWLSDEKISQTPAQSILLRPQISNDLIVAAGKGKWLITKRLTPDVALHESLTLLIAHLLVPGREALEQIADSKDRRMISDSIAWTASSEYENIAPYTTAPKNSSLILLFLAILVVERFVAYSRNQ
ncbi:hypothetical protein BH10BAC4_BH10BAC4_24750 [soil metagenome]